MCCMDEELCTSVTETETKMGLVGLIVTMYGKGKLDDLHWTGFLWYCTVMVSLQTMNY